MTASIIFSILSFVYIILISCVYFSKSRLKNEENKIYTWLIMANFLGLFIEIFILGSAIKNNAKSVIISAISYVPFHNLFNIRIVT